MKIAFVLHSLKSGGAERAVSNLSLELENDHDVSVILFDTSDIGYSHGGKLIDLESPSKTSAFGKVINIVKRAFLLNRLYREEKFDAIYTFMEAAGFPSVMASKETIVSVHDDPRCLPKIYQPFLSVLYPRAKKTVACSLVGEKKLIDLHHLKNTTTIFNSIDLETAQQRSKETVSEQESFILAAGRLAPQKGFDYLIEAFSHSEARNKSNLFILGEGEERDNLQQLIEKHGLTNKVFLKGQVENPYAYYSQADMFVLSSRHEGFPNILIEALACQCPCVSFDCETGPNEIITPEENGILVEAENVNELSKAIDRLYFDKNLQNKFKQNSQQSVAHLSTEMIAKDWLNLIQEESSSTDVSLSEKALP